jgi:hypothetical protein
MKISSDTIGNRTRDLPACRAIPHPTAPTCVPITYIGYTIIPLQSLLCILDHTNPLKTKVKRRINTMKMPLKHEYKYALAVRIIYLYYSHSPTSFQCHF